MGGQRIQRLSRFMYRLEEHRQNRWRPVARGLFRSRIRAVTAARSRTAIAGHAHRVVDVELKLMTDLVPAGSIDQPRHCWRGTEPPP